MLQPLSLYLQVLPESDRTEAVKELLSIVITDALEAIDCAYLEGKHDNSAQ